MRHIPDRPVCGQSTEWSAVPHRRQFWQSSQMLSAVSALRRFEGKWRCWKIRGTKKGLGLNRVWNEDADLPWKQTRNVVDAFSGVNRGRFFDYFESGGVFWRNLHALQNIVGEKFRATYELRDLAAVGWIPGGKSGLSDSGSCRRNPATSHRKLAKCICSSEDSLSKL